MLPRDFNFPIWATQGGGYTREVAGAFIFISEPPKGFVIGDRVPREWGLEPANEAAVHANGADGDCCVCELDY